MQKIIFIVLTLILCSYTVNADTNKPRRYIEVTGIAELEVVPDEIYLSITLNEADHKDRRSIDRMERDLVNVIQSLGISTEDLTIAGANSKLVKAFWSGKKIYSRKDYILKLTEAQTIGELLEELERKKIANVHIQRLAHSKIDTFRKRVKIMAIKAAKDKADYLLQAIGEHTGHPIFIQERNNYNPPMYARNVSYAMKNERVKIAPKYKLEFQEMKLKYEVFARFEIVE